MSDVAVRKTAAQELVAQVRSDEFKEQVAMAIPENMPASRFQRAVVTALLQNAALADVERDSFFVAAIRCASLGLLPDGREAAIVPYKGKAQLLEMIGGYRKIAGEHGWTIETVVVYANDVFSYSLGLDPRIDHKPAAINTDRGDLVAAYAIGRHRDGRRMIEVYEASAVQAAKGVAQTDRIWKQWPAQMWEKTVGKRLFAKLPLDPNDKRVAGLMVDAEVIGPEASAAMLYGPGGTTFAAREISSGLFQAAPATENEADGNQPVPDEGSQQAAEVVSDEAAASAAPGFPIPQAVVDKAGAMIVQDGWTVESICADASGPSWVKWALDPESDTAGQGVTAAMVDATRLYVGQKHPELLGGAS